MTRVISFVALVGGIALLVAAPGWGKGQPLRTDPATEAQILRGEALDRHYGLGSFAVDPATEAQILRGEALDRHYGLGTFAVDPATEAQILRGEALDRHYGLGRYSTHDGSKVDTSSEASPVTVTSSGSEVDWEQVGIVVGIGLVLAAGLVAAMRFKRIRPLGH
jgi:hypothetical protein